ncbi:hypothetical protein C8K36_10174 [Rhodococcus sp. OK519]|nr:hypothetical protein C8K36_10174 [Rhodococcus sp. OK519]
MPAEYHVTVDATGTDLGAAFGSLESVSFGSLEQLLGL